MAAEPLSKSPEKPVPWGTPRDQANIGRFALALLLWLLVWIAARLLLDFGALEGAAAWLMALAPLTLSLIVVRHYVRFLRQADELLRLIHLEGLALGFGAAFVFTTTYRLFEKAGAPDLDINDSLMVMVVFWALGMWLARRRYQ
jgi:hypothetical protein